MMGMKPTGDVIKALMKKYHLTMSSLSVQAGIPMMELLDIIEGGTPISERNSEKLGKAIKAKADVIYYYDREYQKSKAV